MPSVSPTFLSFPTLGFAAHLALIACAPQAGEETGVTTAAATTPATTSDATTSEATTSDASATTATSGATSAAQTTGETDTTGATPDPSELRCPESIDLAILACVAEQLADPDLSPANHLIDLLLACGDAEPVADDYDAHCADRPADPICALDYFQFVDQVLPECIARAQAQLFADRCLLPLEYRDLLFAPAIALVERRTVADPADLSPAEAAQLLHTAAKIGHPAATVAGAIEATDDDSFDLLSFFDVGTDRVLTAWSAHYGDTRVGLVFFHGTHTIAAAIEDSFFTRCAIERAVEGQPCQEPGNCAPDHVCHGQIPDLAPGACIWPGSLPPGDPCGAGLYGCSPHTGNLCLDRLDGAPGGDCRPGWMRRSFAGQGAALVPGGQLVVPIFVHGVATVPTSAYLDLELEQQQPNQLQLQLRNPGLTLTPIALTSSTTLRLDLERLPVPSDESAVGVWHLLIDDLGGAAAGQLVRTTLTLDTRWD